MSTFKHLILLLCVQFSRCAEISYELSETTPEFTHKKTIHTKERVTSAEKAFSITILSDLAVLKKGMLDISPNTYYFWMDGRGLEVVEPGAFDNQNIIEEIRLEYNKLAVVATGTFRNLKIKKLDLSYNKITHLEEGAIADLPNLSEVHLSRNRINRFDGNCLVSTPKLWSFDMLYNNLTELGEKWFTFMKKDEAVIIGVGYNEIEKVDPGTFEGITVWNLGLEHNKIKEIPGEIFAKNPIKYLDLDHNELEVLPEEFFRQKNLTSVNLRNNPLKCEVQKRLKKFGEDGKFEMRFDSHNC